MVFAVVLDRQAGLGIEQIDPGDELAGRRMQVHLRSGSRKPAHLEQQAQPRLHRGLRPRFGQRDRPAGLRDAVGTRARRRTPPVPAGRPGRPPAPGPARRPRPEAAAGRRGRSRFAARSSPGTPFLQTIWTGSKSSRRTTAATRSEVTVGVGTMTSGRPRAGTSRPWRRAATGPAKANPPGGLARWGSSSWCRWRRSPASSTTPGRGASRPTPQLSLRDAGGPRLGDRERATSKLLRYPASPCHATSVARPAMPANPPC